MDADKVEPLLFTAWLRAFAEAVFVGQLGDAGKDYWNLRPRVIENVLTAHPEWCAISTASGVGASLRDSSQSGEGRGRDEQALTPRARSRTAATDCFPRPWTARWRACARPTARKWPHGNGDAPMSPSSPNAVFRRIPVLRDWIDVAIPTDGGSDTVNRGAMTIRDEEHPYEHRHGAGLRIVTDLADAGHVADDRGARPIGQPALAAFLGPAAALAGFRLSRARQAPRRSRP